MASAPAESEEFIRDLLAARVRSDDATLIVTELPLAATRADHATIAGDAITLVEVKTATDTLTRLPHQIAAYSAVADDCGVAVAAGHLDDAMPLLPGWWRVEVVRDGRLEVVRAGTPNPRPDPLATALLLWRAELAEAVAEAGQAGGTAGLDRDGLAAVLAATLRADPQRLRAIVRRGLLERRWIDVCEPRGAVRRVRPTSPSWRAKRRGRGRARARARAR